MPATLQPVPEWRMRARGTVTAYSRRSYVVGYVVAAVAAASIFVMASDYTTRYTHTTRILRSTHTRLSTSGGQTRNRGHNAGVLHVLFPRHDHRKHLKHCRNSKLAPRSLSSTNENPGLASGRRGTTPGGTLGVNSGCGESIRIKSVGCTVRATQEAAELPSIDRSVKVEYQGNGGFSVVVSPASESCSSQAFLGSFMANNEDWIRDLLHSKGAVLFRGFDVPTSKAFNDVLPMQLGSDMKKGFVFDVIYKTIIASVFTLFKSLGNIDPKRRMDMAAGGRIQVLAPPSDCIQGPHQESLTLATRLSQRYIAFHCEIQPESHGETAIFDCASAYESLDQDLKNLLDTHSWRFRDVKGEFTSDLIPCVVNHEGNRKKPCIQVYAFGEMGSTAAKVARKVLRRDNLEPDPYLYGVTSFVLRNKATGEDREMSAGERERLMEALYRNAELCSWKKNDILILDNISVAHGRMDGRGARKINFCGICDYLFNINDYPRDK
mmetsp:Transcript_19327/g.34515  ORF Transcript_19327/g.34515 Transcript_19327/m.34515 type:complete len:494 (-) Transcript_19327:232-1713(-)|eukprot:CAMPEP_0197518432 /NCGR_PEP_ID=MMETSP1318-20131121/3616_1 /TAXON_ID=552666 /ORGANISM="Partenskyella glossopodia, Strain RCC365" /LENGTH=493 /DNA_ID=CAMNT_0043068779 /DNA_START=160 /DNA_END=1641 /DNA_ORIENTATION=-